MASKAALRKSVQAALSELSAGDKAAESARVCRRLVAHPAVRAAQHVALYMAMGSEVDLAEAMEQLRDKTLYVPHIDDTTQRMSFAPLHGADAAQPLRRHASGFLQPAAAPESAAAVLARLDVLVVPGRAFDRRGHRLGRGGGYYDRAIDELRATRPLGAPVTLGVAFGAQRVAAVPTESHDHAVDAVLFGDEEGTLALPAKRPLVVDGAMGTELAKAGLAEHQAWISPFLAHEPAVAAAVARVHRRYLEAGADCITTNTYSISEAYHAKLASRCDVDALLGQVAWDDFVTTSMGANAAIARRAVDEWGGDARVLLSLGPYACSIIGRAETANRDSDNPMRVAGYGLSEAELLAHWRARVASALRCSHLVDAWAIETIPDLLECRAIVAALSEVEPVRRPPAWISFTCGTASTVDNGHSFAECVAAVARLRDVVAGVGINCTAPAHVAPLLRVAHEALREAGLDLPLVCIPNSGEQYISRALPVGASHWRPDDNTVAASEGGFAALAAEWVKHEGVRVIGGCCRTTPDDIAAVVGRVAPSKMQ